MWQLVELKEAEEKSLKESERLEKEIVEVQEMKVMDKKAYLISHFVETNSHSLLFSSEKDQHHDC